MENENGRISLNENKNKPLLNKKKKENWKKEYIHCHKFPSNDVHRT